MFAQIENGCVWRYPCLCAIFHKIIISCAKLQFTIIPELIFRKCVMTFCVIDYTERCWPINCGGITQNPPPAAIAHQHLGRFGEHECAGNLRLLGSWSTKCWKLVDFEAMNPRTLKVSIGACEASTHRCLKIWDWCSLKTSNAGHPRFFRLMTWLQVHEAQNTEHFRALGWWSTQVLEFQDFRFPKHKKVVSGF